MINLIAKINLIKKLYLLTGKTFKAGETPDYLTVVLKEDVDLILSAIMGIEN